MAALGAPTKLTRDLCERFVAIIRGGNYFITACNALGIDEKTAYNWLHWGEDGREAPGDWPEAFSHFFQSVKRAAAEAEIQAVAEIQLAGRPHAKRTRTITLPDGTTTTEELEPGQWQALMTFLERRHRDRWGRSVTQEITGAGAGPLQVVIRGFTDAETGIDDGNSDEDPAAG